MLLGRDCGSAVLAGQLADPAIISRCRTLDEFIFPRRNAISRRNPKLSKENENSETRLDFEGEKSRSVDLTRFRHVRDIFARLIPKLKFRWSNRGIDARRSLFHPCEIARIFRAPFIIDRDINAPIKPTWFFLSYLYPFPILFLPHTHTHIHSLFYSFNLFLFLPVSSSSHFLTFLLSLNPIFLPCFFYFLYSLLFFPFYLS